MMQGQAPVQQNKQADILVELHDGFARGIAQFGPLDTFLVAMVPTQQDSPISMWFTTNNQLKCFCGKMHLISWIEGEPPIMKCDGRELALLALLQQEEN